MGGLGQISPVFWLGTIALAAYIELESLDREKEGKMPGDVGFDPLSMQSDQMEEAELANGRLAMLAGFRRSGGFHETPRRRETSHRRDPLLLPSCILSR